MSAPADFTVRPGGLRRADFLRAAAAAAVAPVLMGAPAPAAAHRRRVHHAPWPLPARDLAATRAARREPRGVAVLWRQPLAGGLTSAPLVVGDTVYAASLGGDVVAVGLQDGRERWRRAFEPAAYGSGEAAVQLGFFGGGAVAGHRLVVASDRVRCLDRRTGEVLWEAAPLRGTDGDDYFWGAPVAACGLVLVGSGAGSEASATRGRVSAYALRDGRLVWSTPTVPEGGNGGGVLAPVSVDPARGAVFAGTGAPYLPTEANVPGTSAVVELALADGRVRWVDQLHPADTLGLDVNSAPMLLGDTMAVTAKDGVWAWDRRTRRRAWHRQLTPATPAEGGPAGPVNGPEGGPIAGAGDCVYALSNDGDAGHAVAAALDRRSGAVRWQTALGGLAFAAPAVVGGLLAAATASGDLELLRRDDGARVARVALGGPSASPVSAARGRLLVGVGAEPFLPGGELVCVG